MEDIQRIKRHILHKRVNGVGLYTGREAAFGTDIRKRVDAEASVIVIVHRVGGRGECTQAYGQ